MNYQISRVLLLFASIIMFSHFTVANAQYNRSISQQQTRQTRSSVSVNRRNELPEELFNNKKDNEPEHLIFGGGPHTKTRARNDYAPKNTAAAIPPPKVFKNWRRLIVTSLAIVFNFGQIYEKLKTAATIFCRLTPFIYPIK